MKILFFSDIHGITKNLKNIKKLEDKENFDKIVILGDLYYTYHIYNDKNIVNIKEINDFLINYSNKIICLKGNCDFNLDIKSTNLPIYDNLVLISVDDLDLYLTHGNKYNKKNNNEFKNKKGILVYGHEHIPYIEKQGNMTYINVGSISLPRKGSKASYLIYKNKTFTLYSIEQEIIDKIEFL